MATRISSANASTAPRANSLPRITAAKGNEPHYRATRLGRHKSPTSRNGAVDGGHRICDHADRVTRVIRLRSPGILATAMAIGLAAAVSSCSAGQDSSGYASLDGAIRQIPPGSRGPSIDLSGTTLNGAAFTLRTQPGKVTVVNVWWSGCPECRSEAPILSQVSKELGESATFLGIDIRDASPGQGKSFESTFDISYPSIYDPSGKALLAFNGATPIRAMPSTIVLDEHRRIAATVIGALPSIRTLKELIADAQAGAQPGAQSTPR